MFVQRVIGLQKGVVQFDGKPDALTPDVLTKIYGEEDWKETTRSAEEAAE